MDKKPARRHLGAAVLRLMSSDPRSDGNCHPQCPGEAKEGNV